MEMGNTVSEVTDHVSLLCGPANESHLVLKNGRPELCLRWNFLYFIELSLYSEVTLRLYYQGKDCFYSNQKSMMSIQGVAL